MHALVLYDSVYGNTERVAQAIAAGLSTAIPTDLATIDAVEELPSDLALLVIGGPTQAHGNDPEMKAYLEHLADAAVDDLAIATFDTRLHIPALLSGSAALTTAKKLTRKGARLVAKPRSFFVTGKEGPLVDGEIERAEEWARGLLAALDKVTIPAAEATFE